MKRFQFPEHRVLRLKQQQLQYAKWNVARAHQALLQARGELRDAEQQLHQHLQRMRDQAQPGASLVALVVKRQALPALTRSVALALQRVRHATHAWNSLRDQMQQKRREVDSLTDLWGIRWREYRQQRSGEQQRNMDDNAMRTWLTERASKEEC